MKAIILARVSDKKQDSNEAQVNRVSDYVTSKNLAVWLTVEIEESSTKGDRKKFQEVIAKIQKSKEPIALVVDTVDRLQRSFRESVLLDDLRKAGKLEIHFYRENLVVNQTSNSADLLRWDMAVMFAKSYVLQLSDNVKRKLDAMRKNGEWISRPPIGYKSVYNNDKRTGIIPDEYSAAIVRLIFEKYATGDYSLMKIRQELISQGYKSKNEKVFTIGRVYRILNNPFYYGEMVSKGETFDHIYPPLIDRQLYDRCQNVLKSWKKKPFQHVAKPYIFRGLLTCAKCGCTMTPETAKGTYVYYSCTNARRTICHVKVYVPEKVLLKPIFDILFTLSSLSQYHSDVILSDLKQKFDNTSRYHASAIGNLQTERELLQTRTDRLLDLLLEKTISKSDYEDKRKELKAKQYEILNGLQNHANSNGNFYITAATVLRLAKSAFDLFNSSDVSRKRKLLNFMLQNSEVEGKKPIYSLRSPFDALFSSLKCSDWCPDSNTFGTVDWQQVTDHLVEYGYLERTVVKDKAVITLPEPRTTWDYQLLSLFVAAALYLSQAAQKRHPPG